MISPVNLRYINEHPSIEQILCDIVPYYEVAEAELDEMWSYVFSKENPRWLWVALDHQNRQILAYAFGRRKIVTKANNFCLRGTLIILYISTRKEYSNADDYSSATKRSSKHKLFTTVMLIVFSPSPQKQNSPAKGRNNRF